MHFFKDFLSKKGEKLIFNTYFFLKAIFIMLLIPELKNLFLIIFNKIFVSTFVRYNIVHISCALVLFPGLRMCRITENFRSYELRVLWTNILCNELLKLWYLTHRY